MLALLWALVLAPVGMAQRVQPSPRAEALGRVFAMWAERFDRGGLNPDGDAVIGPREDPIYQPLFQDGGGGIPGGPGRTRHESALFRLLADADRERGDSLLRGLLALSAVGLHRGPADLAARRIRTVAQSRLAERFRAGDRDLLRAVVSGGEVVPVSQRTAAAVVLGAAGPDVGDAARLARLLLLDDPRLRLAGAEGLAQVPSAAIARPLAEALNRERHPVVAQALVSALRACMNQDGITEATRTVIRASCRFALGRAGWRADIALVEFLEQWPDRPAVTALINLLQSAQPGADIYLDQVDPTASPRLGRRIHKALLTITGVLLPADPAAWVDFWEKQGRNLEIRPRPVQAPEDQTTARFYGVPVTGRNVVFLLDASGSMNRGASDRGGRVRPGTPRRERRADEPSRLELAQQRVLEAVQAMDPEQGVFRVWSFAETPILRTGEARRPGRRIVRELSDQLAAIEAGGGTDLYAALVAVLGADRDPIQDVVQANPDVPDELFVLSDGEPSAGAVRDPETILQVVREANRYRRVRIHCILIGDGRGEELLREIARGSGGVYVRGVQ